MKMACLRGHFLIIIRKDTGEDCEKNIAFSWNPDLLLDGAKDKLHQDGGGRQLCSKWNLDVLLDGTKDNLS
jgi:hypothetical protein